MPDSSSSGRLRFDVTFPQHAPAEPVEDAPALRVVVIGDFSGAVAGAAGGEPVARRVDIDTLDAVFSSWQATLITSDAPPLALRTLEEFHPDSLLERHPVLAARMALRARLLAPATAAAALADLRLESAASNSPLAAPGATAAAESPGDTLSRLLGGAVAKPAAAPLTPPRSDPEARVERLMRAVTAGSVSAALSPEAREALVQLEADLTRRLRGILQDPRFQSLEAAWRSLDRLVREADDTVRLHVINASPLELAADLDRSPSPLASALGRRLEPLAPSLIVVLHTFDAPALPSLSAFARLAAALRTALVAGSSPQLVGCASFAQQPHVWDWTAPSGADAEAFSAFRRTPEAGHIGLALPRFLLRQPYGAGSDPVSHLAFEEIDPAAPEPALLWGNSAVLCAHLLLLAAQQEESLDGISGGQVDGLPLYRITQDGEAGVVPPAEAWLSERDADAILRHGLIPVLSVRGSDTVLLPSLRSLAEPATALPFRQD